MSTRESFEKWLGLQGKYTARDDKGFYVDMFSEGLWQAWQASRKAIVLPESTEGHIAGEYGNGYMDALHVAKQAIGGK